MRSLDDGVATAARRIARDAASLRLSSAASRRRHFGAPRAEEDYIESTTNALVKRFKGATGRSTVMQKMSSSSRAPAFVARVLARGDDVEAVLVADDVTLDASLFARAKRMARAPDFVLKAASARDSPQGCVALVARPRLAFPPRRTSSWRWTASRTRETSGP